MRFISIFLALLLATPVSAETTTATATVGAPAIRLLHLKIAGHVLSAEVAHTQAARSQGLMYRHSMKENSGMLFVFPEASRHSMWMVNTNIPLSVAFVDETGAILNIADMAPHTETAHSAAGAAKYAVETNFGWFRARGIKAGNRIMGLGKAPPAE